MTANLITRCEQKELFLRDGVKVHEWKEVEYPSCKAATKGGPQPLLPWLG